MLSGIMSYNPTPSRDVKEYLQVLWICLLTVCQFVQYTIYLYCSKFTNRSFAFKFIFISHISYILYISYIHTWPHTFVFCIISTIFWKCTKYMTKLVYDEFTVKCNVPILQIWHDTFLSTRQAKNIQLILFLIHSHL